MSNTSSSRQFRKGRWHFISLAMCGLLFASGANEANATNYFNWGAESNTTSLGPIQEFKSNTVLDCTVSRSGSCSMRLNVKGADSGNGDMGVDVGQNPYSWNLVGSRALYYR